MITEPCYSHILDIYVQRFSLYKMLQAYVVSILMGCANWETFVADTNFVSGTQNVSDFVQKHFVSVTNVSQFAQPIIIDTIYACNSLYKENLWTYVSRICE